MAINAYKTGPNAYQTGPNAYAPDNSDTAIEVKPPRDSAGASGDLRGFDPSRRLEAVKESEEF